MSPAFQSRPAVFSQPRRGRQPTVASIPKSQAPAHVIDTTYDSSGVRLATAQSDGTISLWRASSDNSGISEWLTYAHFATKHAPSTLQAIRFAPDRLCPDLLVTVGSDGLAIVYKLQTLGEEVSATETLLRDSSDGLTDVAFADNGLLATLGEEHVLRIYETPDNGERWGLVAAVDVGRDVPEARGVSFAPGAAFCVACGDIVARGNVAWEWEVYARIGEGEEGGAGNAIICADWASSGFIGVGRADGAVEVWQMREGRLTRIARMGLDGEERSKAVKIEWDRAGGILATAHEDKMLQTWTRISGDKTGEWRWSMRDRLNIEDI